MKRYEVCARGYAWLAERESADGLWVKYDEAAAECDELRQQLTKANTMLLFTRAERDSLQQQLAAAQERERTLRDALDNMVRQFAYAANGKRSTGGLSTLEQAFEALGLDDPHSLDTKEMCDEPGCNAPLTCGWPSSAGYRTTCGKHYKPDPQYVNPEQEGVVERQNDKSPR